MPSTTLGFARVADGTRRFLADLRASYGTLVEPAPPAAQQCEGCDQPASDVGHLTLVCLTYRNGLTAFPRYCEGCLEMAEASVRHPGESYGAAALPAEFVRVERHPYFHALDLNTAKVLGQRFALAIRLNAHGSERARHEDGRPHVAGEMVVVYSTAGTIGEAWRAFQAWGDIMDVTPLFNPPRELVCFDCHGSMDHQTADGLCRRCRADRKATGFQPPVRS